jgi:hypothetical protein
VDGYAKNRHGSSNWKAPLKRFMIAFEGYLKDLGLHKKRRYSAFITVLYYSALLTG